MDVLDSRHPFFSKFVSLMRKAAAKPPVSDLGTSSRFAKEVGLVRHLFDEAQYFAGRLRPDMSLGHESCDLDRDIDSSHATYGDFWRPTHEGLALMFGDAGFRRVDVFPVVSRVISRLQLLGIYPSVARIPGVRQLISRLDRPQLGRTTSLHFVRAEK